jgi:hypothetical protein
VGLRGAVAVAVAQGPSCLYVGPIETASQEKLEALYHQVRYHFVITIIMLRLITLSFRLSDSRGERRFFPHSLSQRPAQPVNCSCAIGLH